jgi:hypothetical protein
MECKQCGSSFSAKTKRAKYCSDKCRVLYHRSKPVGETAVVEDAVGDSLDEALTLLWDEAASVEDEDTTITQRVINKVMEYQIECARQEEEEIAKEQAMLTQAFGEHEAPEEKETLADAIDQTQGWA